MKWLFLFLNLFFVMVNAFALTHDVPKKSVLINEVMVNPVGLTAFPETEYVEIYNASDTVISLKDWLFIYDGKPTTLPDIILPIGSYAVLYRAGREIYVEERGIALPIATFPANLANTGKTVQLKDGEGLLIDSVTYKTAKAAQSWERDMDGNLYLSNDPRGGTPGSVNSSKGIPEPPVEPVVDNSQPGDVLINEVMADPVGLTAFPETEYVEIYNASDTVISLKDWLFIYDGKPTTLPDIILPIGSYAVLYRAGREIYVDDGGIALPIAGFPANLANTGKMLQLKNPTGIVIDSVTYKIAKVARSWERDAEENWYLSNDLRGGTPGSMNSSKENPEPPIVDNSQSGDMLINEVMANPVGLTTFPETEYVEIYNASDSVISLKGWSFLYDGKPSTLPDTALSTGSYAVLFRDGHEIYVDNGGIALPIASFPANLANTSKTLQLKNSAGIIIDSFTYRVASPACSWERDVEDEWHLSNDPRGGTPGSANSSKEIPVPPTPDFSQSGDVLINEIMANPVGLTDLPETEYVEIYNISNFEIHLKGWSFFYDGKPTVLPDTTLSVGSYAVLFRTGREIYVNEGGIALPIGTFPANLANTGKTLQLKNSAGVVIDSITYKTAKAARSWERDPDGSLYLSNDLRGGTPGSVNSSKEILLPPEFPDFSEYGDVLINEIMANPVGLTGFPETEYVELYNASDSVINLKDWSFLYDGKPIALPDTNLLMDGYAILYRAGRDIQLDTTSGIALALTEFPANLVNTGKTLQLKNSTGVVIDSITYKTAKAARSWERDSDGGLYLSNDLRGGTPGSVNSSKEIPLPPELPDFSKYGDVLINEIMANPIGLTTFPETEYVEIYNTSDSVVSLSGWSFIYDGKITAFPHTNLSVGGYALLYRAGRDIYVDDGGFSIPITSFPASLSNTGKLMQLKNSSGILIDSVIYITAKAARSWERDSDGSLYLSNDLRGGTPGSLNSLKKTLNPPTEEDSSKFGDVLINEIMADPIGLTAFPETEYVELYNASNSVIDLKDWTFMYDGKPTILPEIALPAEGYVVLIRAGRNMYVDNKGILAPVATFPVSLANTGKVLQLKNSAGTLIDSMSYKTAKAAHSWERDSKGNWYLSNDVRGGTPGAINSLVNHLVDPDAVMFVDQKDLIFNEILAEPFVEGSEYIELFNRSARSLFLTGLSVATRKNDGTLSTQYTLSSITDSLESQGYLVLSVNRNGVLDFYYTPSPYSVYELKLPVLNNTGTSLVLLRTKDEVVIDEVSYLSKWHDSSIKNVKGVSLERIYPDSETQNYRNWTSATFEVGYGTPGYKNSQYGTVDDKNTIQITVPEYMDGFNEYIIHYQTDKIGYRCRMHVFTPEGVKMAEISNNQLVGMEGEIRWDGKGLDGNKLYPGVYIFNAELYHPEGQKKTFKKVFLIKP